MLGVYCNRFKNWYPALLKRNKSCVHVQGFCPQIMCVKFEKDHIITKCVVKLYVNVNIDSPRIHHTCCYQGIIYNVTFPTVCVDFVEFKFIERKCLDGLTVIFYYSW